MAKHILTAIYVFIAFGIVVYMNDKKCEKVHEFGGKIRKDYSLVWYAITLIAILVIILLTQYYL